ncbi:ABC transporter substrate-binding protein [Streptomyces sp. NPDC048611]|uniref:caspase, EACC1-associated type n=1 Tax=Streptomyces sp. NPDC048611 TaxID=3155635 RepID=UPI00341DDE6A
MTILPDPAASQAVLIGVHDYENLAALPAVERNLAGLTRVFTDPDLWGLPPEHCVALSQPPSAQDVLDTLSGVAQRATDTLVVYYAGHGLLDPLSDELYLALPGSDQERLYSALPFEWVRRAILDPQIGARHKVVILDCCYSGRALEGGMGGSTQVADHALIDGTSLMAAAAKTRKALSPPGEEYTAFTGELITVLTEGIVAGPPLLDMQTLYRHLHTALAAKSRPLPQQRNRNTGGLIALARNAAHPGRRPQPPSAPSPAPPVPAPESAAVPGPDAAPGTEAVPVPGPDPVSQPVPEPQRPSVEPAPTPDRTSAPTPEARGEELQRTAAAPRQLTAPEVPRTDGNGQGSRGNPVSARTRAVALVSAAALIAGVSTTLVLWNGADGEDAQGPSKGGATTKATYNAAIGHLLRPGNGRGGTLRFISTTDADSWDPQRSSYPFVANFARYYTRQLVTYKPGSKGTDLTPDLATDRAEVSGDGKTYTYTLREGATWEDGSPVTSQDVKYGIERLWAPEVISGGLPYLQQVLDPDRTYRGPYKDTSATGSPAIKTPNSHTIVFELPRPNGDFEQMLAMPAASPVKKSQDTKAKYGAKPFSSGPYRFHSYQPGKSLELVRNSHWKKASDPVRTALPDKITVAVENNPDAVDAALAKGDYDLALAPTKLGPLSRAGLLSGSDRRKNLDSPPSGFVRYVGFPQTVEPMDNVACRRAVVYAADRRNLQTALGGTAAGGDLAPSLLPPGIRGADPAFDPYGILQNGGAPDLTRARAELKKCGRPNGFPTTIAVRDDRPADTDTAEALRSALARVGIRAEVERFDGKEAPTIVGAPSEVKKRGYGIVLASWGADFPTGQGFWPPLVDSRMRPPSGNYNVAEVDSPALDKLLDQAIAERDPDKAGETNAEINHKVAEGAYYLPLVYEKYVSWRGPRLTNVQVAPAYGGYDFTRLGVNGT